MNTDRSLSISQRSAILPKHHIDNQLMKSWTLVVACSGILVTSIWLFGNRQFGAYDYSTLIDVGWRLFTGQKPYEDFFLTLPPAFYLGAELALKLFGIKWSAFVATAALFSVVTFVVHVAVLQRLVTRQFSISLALVCQLLAMVVTSYWWYNSITVIAGCLFLTSAFLLNREPESRFSRLTFLASLVVLMLMKPNIAIFLILFTVGALCIKKQLRAIALMLLITASIVTLLILIALGINPGDVLESYLEASRSRALPSIKLFFTDKLEESFISIPLIITCLIPAFVTINWIRLRGVIGGSETFVLFLLSATGILVSFLGFFTNYESNLVGMATVLLGSFLLVLLSVSHDTAADKPGWMVTLSIVAGLLAVLVGLFTRDVWVSSAMSLETLPFNVKGIILIGTWLFLNIVAISGLLVHYGVPTIKVRVEQVNPLRAWLKLLGERRLTTMLQVIVVATCLVALYAGAMRWRVKGIGPFYSASGSLAQISEPTFFEHLSASPTALRVISETDQVLKSSFDKNKQLSNAPVFFGPRMEFAYAAFGINSPRDMPIWWHPGSSFPESEMPRIIKAFTASDFQIGIFLGSSQGQADFTRIPNEIIEVLSTNYVQTAYENIVVFTRRQKTP